MCSLFVKGCDLDGTNRLNNAGFAGARPPVTAAHGFALC